MSKLLSERVKKVPSAQVSSDRYLFLKLSEAEPDLGVPAETGYVLSSTVEGVRSWIPQGATTAVGTDGQLTYNNNGVAAGTANIVYDDVNQVLSLATDLQINSNIVINSNSESTTSTTATLLKSFSTTVYGSGKFVIQSHNTVTDETQITELLVTHNGTTAIATEYGVLYTGESVISSYEVDITSGNVRILTTSSVSDQIN